MRRIGGRLFAGWALLLALPLAAVVTLPILLTAVIPRGWRERYNAPMARLYTWICVRLILLARPTVRGLEHLPARGGYLIVCNHRSWMDVALLICMTGSVGISKREIAWVPFFGLAGWLAGAIFFDRRDPASRARVVEEAVGMMGRTARLHVFPEGSRTRDGRLAARVHLRLVEACWRAKIPVLPAWVWDTERVLPATGLLAWPGQRPGLEVGAAVDAAAWPDAASFAAAVWEQVRAGAHRNGADQPFNAGTQGGGI